MPLGRAALLALLLASGARAQEGPAFGFGFAYRVGTDGQPVVSAVAPGSAAEAAGLAPGDSLLAAGEVALTGLDAEGVGDAIDAARGDAPEVPFRIVREGLEATVRVGRAPYDPDGLLRASRVFYCAKGDCLDGRGVWRAPDGERYEGPFADGFRHGEGTLVLANGDLYVGTFRRGVIHGAGTYVWADGDLYAGDVREGRPHGRGVRTYGDGAVYTGKFADGLPHGTGTLRRPDGSYWTGTWEAGVGTDGTDHAPDGAVRGAGPYAE